MKYILCAVFLMIGMFSEPANSADWRFPLGMTYISGFGDVVDITEDNLKAQEYRIGDVSGTPIGVSFHPYVHLDSGLRVGAGLGPIAAILSAGDFSFIYSDVPINVNVGYTFFPKGNISPYLRGGLVNHIVSSEFVDQGMAVGGFAGLGVEFLRKRAVGFGMEVGYDATELEFDDLKRDRGGNIKKSVRPYGLTINFFAVF